MGEETPCTELWLCDNQACQIRRESKCERVADKDFCPCAIQPGIGKPLPQPVHLFAILINGNHVQFRLMEQFFDQTLVVDTQQQRVPVSDS